MHDNVQMKSSSTLTLLLHFVFMATRTPCLSQKAFINCTLCSKWWATWQFPCRDNF